MARYPSIPYARESRSPVRGLRRSRGNGARAAMIRARDSIPSFAEGAVAKEHLCGVPRARQDPAVERGCARISAASSWSTRQTLVTTIDATTPKNDELGEQT